MVMVGLELGSALMHI